MTSGFPATSLTPANNIYQGGFTASGTITLANVTGCGGLQTNGTGVVSCTSDINFKDVHSDFTAGLDAIMQIHPKTYSWKKDTYLYDGGIDYSGFIAQDVQAALPQGVSTGSQGQLQLNTTTVLAATVNAIKDLNLKVTSLASIDVTQNGSLASLIRSYLESATNGIRTLFADKVQTKELCLDDVCVTKTQLQQLLNQGGVQPSSVETTPPTILVVPAPDVTTPPANTAPATTDTSTVTPTETTPTPTDTPNTNPVNP
jgi:hypothetical protein